MAFITGLLTYAWNNIAKFSIVALGAFSYYIYGKNKKLEIEKDALIDEANMDKKTILVQKKIINVNKDFKAGSVDDNIKRMRNKKL